MINQMPNAVTPIIILLVGHWVGDFLLQWDEMAFKKATSIKWLAVHVVIYSCVIFMAAFFILPLGTALAFTFFNALLHFATDYVSSRFAVKYKNVPRIFYPIIGFDQLIHTSALVVLLGYYT